MHISLASGTWRQFVVRTVVDGSLFWGAWVLGTLVHHWPSWENSLDASVVVFCVRRKRRLITHITQNAEATRIAHGSQRISFLAAINSTSA